MPIWRTHIYSNNVSILTHTSVRALIDRLREICLAIFNFRWKVVNKWRHTFKWMGFNNYMTELPNRRGRRRSWKFAWRHLWATHETGEMLPISYFAILFCSFRYFQWYAKHERFLPGSWAGQLRLLLHPWKWCPDCNLARADEICH